MSKFEIKVTTPSPILNYFFSVILSIFTGQFSFWFGSLVELAEHILVNSPSTLPVFLLSFETRKLYSH